MMMFGAKVNLTPDQERAVTLAEHAMARALLPNWNVCLLYTSRCV